MSRRPDPFATIDRHHVPIDRLLRRLLEACTADPQLAEDLDYLGFQIDPILADEIDCNNPWFFVVAMNGSGSAYGLYLHPDALRDGLAPWAFWEHEDDTIVALADDTDTLLRGLLTLFSDYRMDDRLARVRAGLARIGVAVDAAPVTLPFDATGPDVAWLPPARDELQTTAQYIAMLPDDRSTAERGLLGRCQYHGDGAARAALDDSYAERGWSPPGADASE